MASFEQLSTPAVGADGELSIDIPAGWAQGRGAFGGLVLAALTRSCERVAARPELRVRTLTATLCGPAMTGPARIQVEVLRNGSGTAALAARLVQRDEVQAHAVAVLGRDRAADVAHRALQPPTLPPWAELPVSNTPGAEFAQNVEFRNVGPTPFSNADAARTAGWVRFREPGARRDASLLVALADIYWPAMFSVLPSPRPAATITYTVELIGGFDGLDHDAPVFHESEMTRLQDGYAHERRVLWGEDGRLLAINHQTFVVIK